VQTFSQAPLDSAAMLDEGNIARRVLTRIEELRHQEEA